MQLDPFMWVSYLIEHHLYSVLRKCVSEPMDSLEVSLSRTSLLRSIFKDNGNVVTYLPFSTQ